MRKVEKIMVMKNDACQITLESTSETLINLPDSMTNILNHILNILGTWKKNTTEFIHRIT